MILETGLESHLGAGIMADLGKWETCGICKLSKDLQWLLILINDERMLSINVSDLFEVIAGHVHDIDVKRLNR